MNGTYVKLYTADGTNLRAVGVSVRAAGWPMVIRWGRRLFIRSAVAGVINAVYIESTQYLDASAADIREDVPTAAHLLDTPGATAEVDHATLTRLIELARDSGPILRADAAKAEQAENPGTRGWVQNDARG